MKSVIGIRREDKNKWEKRVPIIPTHVSELCEKHGIKTIIQPSPIRIFSEKDYKSSGADVSEDLSSAPFVLAVKEIPIDFFQPNKTYMFFSHTIKGQKYNMPMLKHMMDLGCTLIDYEKIVDENNRRLVFFGRFAGIAGMTDSLWALGQQLKSEGVDTPFSEIRQTIDYDGKEDIKKHISEVGKKIQKDGLPKFLTPLICGFAGYGNVSRGAQEVYDLLPVTEISPSEIESVFDSPSDKHVYKVVFREEHMVKPKSSDSEFALQDYYQHPEKYKSVFNNYTPKLTLLMNCIYWNKQYPRLIIKEFLKESFVSDDFMFRVVGDISCDINGAIEFTQKATEPDSPVFVYNPLNDSVNDGYVGEGVVVMSVDNLPCELPRDSSKEFSDSLWHFIPDIVKADFSVDFNDLKLPDPIKKAVILYHGRLTSDYEYINKFL